jgi:hypothetical protein
MTELSPLSEPPIRPVEDDEFDMLADGVVVGSS